MSTKVPAAPNWSTSSFGDAADTTPMELTALGEHLNLCKGSSGRVLSMRFAARSMHGVVSSRFVTTLVAAAVLLGTVALAI